MPYIKPHSYKTPKEVIESVPDINKKEAVFTKKKGPYSKLKQIGIKRETNAVYCDSNDIKNRLYHTHVQSNDSDLYYISLPSPIDLLSCYGQRNKKNITIQGIFIIDGKTGKNMGRTFYTFTDKTDKIIDGLYKKYRKFISKKAHDPLINELISNSNSATRRILKLNIGVTIFQKKKFCFNFY